MIDAAWTLRVENITKGWTLETYAGEAAPDTLEPGDCVLEDGYKGTWGWADYPADFQPRTVQFKMRAGSSATLDAMGVDPGDLFDVHLFHEYIDPPPGFTGLVQNTWHRVVGFLDEPEAVLPGNRGVQVTLAVSDPLALLAETMVDDPNPWPAELLGARLERIAQTAGINIVSMATFAGAATMGPMTVSNQGALPLIQACLRGTLSPAGDQLVLRASVGSIENPALHDQITYDTFYTGDDPAFVIDPVSGLSTGTLKPVYYIDTVNRDSHMGMPYVLTADHDLGAPGSAPGVGLYVVQREPVGDLHLVSGGAALDAGDVLREGTSWSKSRASAINQIKLTGLDNAGEEMSVQASLGDLVRADGPSTRVVQTSRLLNAGSTAVAVALLPDPATAVPAWTAEQFTFTTRDLEPAELDQYSRKLYPREGDGAFTPMQLPVAIVGVDETRAPTGNDLSGILQAATVQLDKGVLTIVGELRAELLRPTGLSTGILTWDQLRTEPVWNDPSLDWAEFSWHSDDAVPYNGSDKVGDASQAHPMFGHEQLSWRDLRLIGVDN